MKIFDHFGDRLIAWFKANQRPLPWRRTRDPYRIWISEIMLQQTTVKAVIPYYQRWVKQFPGIRSVSSAPISEILKAWQGLGYYQRVRNIHKTAKIIACDFHGIFPDKAEILRKLPGFGPYTTGAVLSIAFAKPYTIVDANVRRVVMRVLAIRGVADIRHDKRIIDFLEMHISQADPSAFNQGLMELGALVCRPRDAQCHVCPVNSLCAAYKKGVQEIIPAPRKHITKNIHVAIGVIKRQGKYFLQKRPAKGLLADLWEFPGGKMERKETPLKALAREMKEELNVDIVSSKLFFQTKHYYTEFCVHLHVFACRTKTYPRADARHHWVDLESLGKYPMPSGSAKIVRFLLDPKNKGK